MANLVVVKSNLPAPSFNIGDRVVVRINKVEFIGGTVMKVRPDGYGVKTDESLDAFMKPLPSICYFVPIPVGAEMFRGELK